MRKASIEYLKTIEVKEKELELEKVLTELKSAINDEMVKTARSGELDNDVDKFLILGRREYDLIRNNTLNKIFINEVQEGIPFDIGSQPFKLWSMNVIVLSTVESFIGVAVNKLYR